MFTFLKYLQPTHYFQLNRTDGSSIFPKVETLPKTIQLQLIVDVQYKSKLAQIYDRSWRAVQQGYIGDATNYTNFEPLSIYDNYVFVRKYFHKAWIWYVLFVRLLTLNNPIIELRAFFRSRQVLRALIQPLNLDRSHTISADFQTPSLVSVIIPTLNRYNYLADILRDFERQTYTNFEVVVVDQSDDFKADFYHQFQLDIKLIRQEEKALWLARNTAIQRAKGSLIALSEDDVRIKPDWLEQHLKCLNLFNAQVSAGLFYPKGSNIPESNHYYAIAQQFATGNAMFYKSVLDHVGLFDRQFEKQRMGDGEFGMRLYLAGFTCVSNPFASCEDLKARSGGLREMGSWDAFRPTSWMAPRPIPSVLYYYRRYFGNKAAQLALLRTVPFSIVPYQFKRNRALLLLGLLLSILLLPLVGYQVYKSWRLSSKMIHEGPLIFRMA